jgi:hypothetical protein
MDWPFGLSGAGMHDWLIDELELGARVAHFIDSENVFPSRAWFLDLEIEEWHRRQTGYDQTHQPSSGCI